PVAARAVATPVAARAVASPVAGLTGPSLLPEDGVARVAGEDHAPDALLAQPVDPRDEVDGARLGAHLEVAASLGELDGCCLARCHRCGRKVVVELVVGKWRSRGCCFRHARLYQPPRRA